MQFSDSHTLGNVLVPSLKLGNCVLLMTIFLFSTECFSQDLPNSFKKSVDSLIEAAPTTYSEIDLVLRRKRKDSVFMRYFAEKAIEKNYLDGQSYAFNQLGRKYRNTSQFSRALALHQRALEVAREAENLEFEVYALNMLSVVYRRSYAIKSALDYHQEALELAESVENPSEGLKRSINVSLNGIGNIYETLEQYDLAIEQFRKSLQLEKELGNELGLAINYQNIGECLESYGKLDEALENYRISLSYNEKINNNMGRGICNNSIAQIFIKQGKNDKALQLLKTTLAKAVNEGDPFVTSSVYITYGWALMEKNELSAAKNNLQKGLDLANKYNLPFSIIKANKLLSELATKLGAYKSSLAYYKRAESLEKETSNDRNLRYVNDMIMRYENEKRTAELAKLAEENESYKQALIKNRTRLLITGILIALLAGILYVLYRQYQLKNEKKVLTLEQSMLRSQMNPHFLFNSLNSIKLYIINNEQKNAVHYLNKFSKLVRKILEASSQKEIPLADELETVELYMNIENIRFSNEIDFEIHIDDNIDPHNVKIPSLILQPFLENALWHGLSSKEGKKKVGLHVTENSKDGFVCISIFDNGIGRDAAEKIKLGKVLKRKSVGIDITKERLANFSRDYVNSFRLEIIDLFESGKAIGTKVMLLIPTV
jgi:tetratricopeptide (TPR) repeat protein